ncbi:MAG: hypothetical protein WCS74_03105 [Dehalococcoidales bacterium]|jgi:hypothetical protein|nr:hypothetical protein [Dehalococcoidales bacterium]MDD3264624.1 hypothetical protein [Dehalococcoidales bacterium]MDD4322300.1 hypothetical protein [Dehalococcoidales bacterium]MDD4794142.1 hypothetical protein [Dehalococcoidales bacterium]MDD5122418.1 hypothetical protein [Dehalococcoidales bacterium]
MQTLAVEYYCLIVLLSMSTIQIAASYSGLHGITLFQKRLFNYFFSCVIAVPCLAILLTWNWHKPTGVIEGAEQFYLFMAGIVSAIGLTMVISSLINHKRFKNNQEELVSGFEALRTRTFFQALNGRLRSLKWRG